MELTIQQVRGEIASIFSEQKKQMEALIREEVTRQINTLEIFKVQKEAQEKIQKEILRIEMQQTKMQKCFAEIEQIRAQISSITLVPAGSQNINIVSQKNFMSEQLIDSQGEEINQLHQVKKIKHAGVQDQQIKEIINRSSASLDNFDFEGAMIELRREEIITEGENPVALQLLGQFPFTQKAQNEFILIKGDWISLGLVHPKWVGDKDSFNRKECIFYLAFYGSIWQGGKQVGEGKPIREGEKVIMTVSPDRISWVVQGEIRGQLSTPQQSLKWVPCIWMCNKGDKLRWQ